MVKKLKCFICESENIEKVFTVAKSGRKHYYCKSCAKKYIVKLPKQIK